MTTFYNKATDTWVRINACNFVIVGDADQVTDQELFIMQAGIAPAPWSEVTIDNVEEVIDCDASTLDDAGVEDYSHFDREQTI